METPFVSQLATSTKMAAEDARWAAAGRRHRFSTADSASSAGSNICLHLHRPNMPSDYYNVIRNLTESVVFCKTVTEELYKYNHTFI